MCRELRYPYRLRLISMWAIRSSKQDFSNEILARLGRLLGEERRDLQGPRLLLRGALLHLKMQEIEVSAAISV